MLHVSSPGKTTLTLILVLLPIGGAVAWFRVSPKASNPGDLPEELSVESLKAQMDDPAKMGRTMRGTFEREDLTDEQRRQAMQNMRRVWRDRIRERMDEYFTASESEADAILDRHLDEFVGRMQSMREARKQREAAQENEGGRGQSPWRGMQQRTQQERKEQSESRSADESARAMLYFNNLRARATERGIQLPGRGGGRRGSRP